MSDGGAGREKMGSVPASIVLNAVSDLINDDQSVVLGDQNSERLIREVYRDVTSRSRREQFEAEVKRMLSTTSFENDDQENEAIFEVLTEIQDELFQREIDIRLIHDNVFEVDSWRLAVYRFIRSRNPDELNELSNTIDNKRIDEAITAIDDGKHMKSVKVLKAAMKDVNCQMTLSLCYTLAAYSACRAGEFEESLSLVQEGLNTNEDAWLPNLIGPVAAQENPRRFDEGDLIVQPYLRITAEVPETTELNIWVGTRESRDLSWQPLEGDLEYLPVPDIAERNHVKIELLGSAVTMPQVHTYYVALGVGDQEKREAKSVDHIFVDGPQTSSGKERVILSE